MRKAILYGLAAAGGLVFLLGIIGTAIFSAAARSALGDTYTFDCVVGTPDPDCPARLAAFNSYNTLTLVSEIAFLAGLVILIIAFVVDLRQSRAAKKAAKASKPP